MRLASSFSSKTNIQRDTEEWRTVVGKAIICFGEIELITYKCLAHIPSDKYL